MKVATGVVRRDPTARPPLAFDRTLQLFEMTFGTPLGCKPGDAGLQYLPHLETPQYRAQAQVSHTKPAVGMPLDEALAPEPPERLPNGRAQIPRRPASSTCPSLVPGASSPLRTRPRMRS